MKQPHVSSQEESQADLKNWDFGPFPWGESLHPSQGAQGMGSSWIAPQELITDAQSSFAVDLNILVLKVIY